MTWISRIIDCENTWGVIGFQLWCRGRAAGQLSEDDQGALPKGMRLWPVVRSRASSSGGRFGNTVEGLHSDKEVTMRRVIASEDEIN